MDMVTGQTDGRGQSTVTQMVSQNEDNGSSR